MKKSFLKKWAVLGMAAVVLGGGLAGCGGNEAGGDSDTVALTNVSYDPTREFYTAYNQMFAEHYQKETGKAVEVTQSHGEIGRAHV